MLWYSLEVSRRGASHEYQNICFRGEIRKIFTGYPPLSRPMRCGKEVKYFMLMSFYYKCFSYACYAQAYERNDRNGELLN